VGIPVKSFDEALQVFNAHALLNLAPSQNDLATAEGGDK
jgi:hypothetical protein